MYRLCWGVGLMCPWVDRSGLCCYCEGFIHLPVPKHAGIYEDVAVCRCVVVLC